jgi:hypothetical protein
VNGIERITAERERQMSVEGWTPQHDDREHAHGELTQAALCYLTGNKAGWPWEMSWWKPSEDRIKDLTKAGALIAAEIDRLARRASQEMKKKGGGK